MASINDMTFLTQLDSVLNDYKGKISRLILGNPGSAAAYYALFQKINNYLIFDPYNKQDYASWRRRYFVESLLPRTNGPGTLRIYHERAKVRRLKEQQLNCCRKPLCKRDRMPDIVLQDVNGAKVALSSLKGKVVLLVSCV